MAGFDISTGSIDLISQPGDIPLDGHDSGPSCNHQCPKCCPPVEEEEDDESNLALALAFFILMAGILFGSVVYLTVPQ